MKFCESERALAEPSIFTPAIRESQQILKSAGYSTGIFGKWHLGDEAAYQPDQRGFDECFIHGAGGIGQTYPGSGGDAPGNSYFNPSILHNRVFEKTSGYCTDVFFRQALKWIAGQKEAATSKTETRKPFFAYITPNAPHGPLDCPPEYELKYAGKVPPQAAKFLGMVTNIDDNFGMLLDRVRDWGLERDTLVIFMTDNGGTAGVQIWNAEMRGAKATPYRGGTRVPALWRWPAGFQGGLDIDQLTAQIDIFPTFAEIAGAKIPEQIKLDGRSLLPLLKDRSAEWPDRTLFTHVGRWENGKAAESKYLWCGVRGRRYHLVNASNKGEKWELFDIENDPSEKTNIIAANPLIADRLRKQLDLWWNEIQPDLVNESVIGPKINPFKELYWKQFPNERPALK
jgi:arylsulfatase A-like enzyme